MSNLFDLFRKIESERAPASPPTHLLVGLGNPGQAYTWTRHNTGFLSIDYIAHKCGASIDRAKFHALIADTVIGGHRVLLMMPQTYMNRSGLAVKEAADFYKIPVENILVFCDDCNLDVARVRIRRSGSDGGQKGLRSIIECTGSSNFPRIRIGIGKKPHPEMDLGDWVLGSFSQSDREALRGQMENVYHAAIEILDGKIDDAMGHYNTK